MFEHLSAPSTGWAGFGRSPVVKPFVEGPGRCSSIKQQASSIKQHAPGNWALRLWQEIKKSCFCELSVSYKRMYPLMRGCINPKCQVSTLLGNTLVNQRQSKYGSMFINRSIVYKLDWGGHVDSVCPDEETLKQLHYPRSAYKSLAF